MPPWKIILFQLSQSGLLPWVVAAVTTVLVLVVVWPWLTAGRREVSAVLQLADYGFDDRLNPYEKFVVETGDCGDPRRRSARRTGNPTPVRVGGYRHQAEPRKAWVTDRCTDGLCVAFDCEVKPGQFLTVRAENAPDTTPWVQVEVRNVRRESKNLWYVGCRFVQRPPWSVLLLFG